MSLREEQCNKVCRILDDVLANRPTERDSLIVAVRKASEAEPHWIPVEQELPEEERECWITPKTTSKVYRGVFTRHYGECHRTGFICDDGFMWLNTALAWMYCEVPEPYKPTVPPECERLWLVQADCDREV